MLTFDMVMGWTRPNSGSSNIVTIEKLCHSVAGGLIGHLSDGEQSWVQIDVPIGSVLILVSQLRQNRDMDFASPISVLVDGFAGVTKRTILGLGRRMYLFCSMKVRAADLSVVIF